MASSRIEGGAPLQIDHFPFPAGMNSQSGFLIWESLSQHDQQDPKGSSLRPERPKAGMGFWEKGS